MLNNKTAKLFIILGGVVIVAAFVVWQFTWLSDWEESQSIADGVKISGYDLSGYDTESAGQMLGIQMKNELSRHNIEISYQDITCTVNAASFAELDLESSIEEAYSIGRTGSKFSDFMTLLKAKFTGVSLEAAVDIDSSALKSELKNLSYLYYVAPQDASIASFDPDASSDQMLTINSQTNGRELNISDTADNVEDAFLSGKDKADAVISEVEAEITDDVLYGLTLNPIMSEYSISDISYEYEAAIDKVIGSGLHQILLPGDELSITEFMGGSAYISSMAITTPDDEYEQVLMEFYPTQIYIACLLSEIAVTERTMYDYDEENIPTGTSCITDKNHDLKIKNTLSCPIIIRVGYDYYLGTGRLFCEIYRPQMEYNTLLRSVIKTKENKTLVDITRVYVDNKGNTIDMVVVETVEKD